MRTLCPARANLARSHQLARKLNQVGMDGLGRLHHFKPFRLQRAVNVEPRLPRIAGGACGESVALRSARPRRLRLAHRHIRIPADFKYLPSGCRIGSMCGGSSRAS
jgi:hypothetical protein